MEKKYLLVVALMVASAELYAPLRVVVCVKAGSSLKKIVKAAQNHKECEILFDMLSSIDVLADGTKRYVFRNGTKIVVDPSKGEYLFLDLVE